METSLYVATAAQRTLEKQLITVANNIANSNTVGFRTESVKFSSLVSSTGSGRVHYPVVAGLHPSVEEGEKLQTGNPLDIALSGNGWFAISTPAGIAYTRDGRMQLNAFGELQTLEGYSMLDSSEAPILITTNSGPPAIHKDGRIEVNGRVVGNIGVFEIEPNGFNGRYGNSAFFASTPGVPIPIGKETTIGQGYVESSNVNPIKELTRLIAITKSFDSAAAIVERADNVISKSIGELGNNLVGWCRRKSLYIIGFIKKLWSGR